MNGFLRTLARYPQSVLIGDLNGVRPSHSVVGGALIKITSLSLLI